jgi:SAM-dependent methyltransferase
MANSKKGRRVRKASDFARQREMKRHYDRGDYYRKRRQNFADRENRFNRYETRNALRIYTPRKKGLDVTGIDYSRKSIGICRRSARKLGLNPGKFMLAEVTRTGLRASSFDAIYSCDVAEHLYPDVYEAMLKEAYRLLKKGGKLIIYTPNPGHIFEILKRNDIVLKRDIAHVDYKTMERLRSSLAMAGFGVKKAFYIESHIPVLKWLEKALMAFAPFLRRRNAVLAVKR